MEFASIKPYPEIRVERPNPEYAKILAQDYAGKVSEDTAIHLYFYQHILAREKDKSFSHIMRSIAITEMHHLDILGETIDLLGLSPIYKTYRTCDYIEIPWTANYVDYTRNYKKMLEADIISETKAIETYQKHIEMIDDKYVKGILQRIIDDEEIHLKIFYNLYNKIKDDDINF